MGFVDRHTGKTICRKLAFAAILSPLSLAIGAYADSPQDLRNLSLEELLNTKVTTVSKKTERIQEAPGAVTVISRQEITGFAATNLGQILNRVVGTAFLSPDVFVDQSVVVRGQEMTPYNNRVLILLNGRPVRDPLTGGLNNSVWATFPLDLVDHIEVVRGPGSVLYGSCAFAGVVNIITRTLDKDSLGGSLALGVGSYSGEGQNANVSYKKGDLQTHLAISRYRDDGPKYSFADYQGTKGRARFFRKAKGLAGTANYRGFSFNAFYGDFDPYSLDGGEYWVPFRYFIQQTAFFVDAGYTKQLNTKVGLNVNTTYNGHRWNANEKQEKQNGASSLIEANLTYKPKDGLNILLGGGYERSTWEGTLFIKGHSASSFLYTQLDYALNSKIAVIGGLQFNKIEGIRGNISPRLGLIANFSNETGAKLLYGRAFRKGYPNETSFAISTFKGNPDLRPELISTFEAQLFRHTAVTQSSLTYYRSRMTDIITRKAFSNPDFYLQYINGGQWEFWGFEYDGKYQLTKRLISTANASYQKNVKQGGIENASLHPNTMIKIGFLYSMPKWSCGVFNAYFGQPHKTTSVKPESLVINKNPEAYNLLSLKASYKLTQKGATILGLSLQGDNLLNEDVRYVDYANMGVNSFYPIHTGRTWYSMVTLSF